MSYIVNNNLACDPQLKIAADQRLLDGAALQLRIVYYSMLDADSLHEYLLFQTHIQR